LKAKAVDRLCWTAADAAELDVLIGELVDTVAAHLERCPVCRERRGWCEPLRGCFDEIVAWRDWRVRQTRAQTLRAEQLAVAWLERVKHEAAIDLQGLAHAA
jgi:hypothetical protein